MKCILAVFVLVSLLFPYAAATDSAPTDSNQDHTGLPTNSDQGPVIRNESYTMGSYDISFDLIGVRNLSVDIDEEERFGPPTVTVSGVRYVLDLDDTNTGEHLELQVIRYDLPRARQAVNDLTDLNEACCVAESTYGNCFAHIDLFGIFSTQMAIDEYTVCFVSSTMSWKATEKVIETLRID